MESMTRAPRPTSMVIGPLAWIGCVDLLDFRVAVRPPITLHLDRLY